ncbi:MAG: glycoside hydrolase family 127 protein [Gracilimonas sp.]
MYKTQSYLLFALLIFISACTQSEPEKLQIFPLTSVELLDSPFSEAQQTNMEYILELDADRLLAPYLIEAGLNPRAPKYGNWESIGLDGHIEGHYLTALALMYASTGDEETLNRLQYALDELQRAQDANGNGYIGGIPRSEELWTDYANGNIDAQGFGLNGWWVPLYNIHKLFAGLRDAYLFADIEQSKEMLIELTDWFVEVNSDLSDEQIQVILQSEHGGLNEVFADVYTITGNQEYLDLSKSYSHRAILDPLVAEEDNLTGKHANTQIPKVVGFQRVAELSEDDTWRDAAKRFWENVVEKRSIAFGGNSVSEHFNPVDDFSTMISSNQGPETCNTYNMLKLTKMLFTDDPDAKYINFYERALYNHILSSQHPDGGFVYFTPIRPRHYRVYSQPHTSFWCCVGSGIENHGKYGELIYAYNESNVYVNLFIPSELNWDEKGIHITQTTKFPYEAATRLRVQVDEPKKFDLSIRKPEWIKGDAEITVNGEKWSTSTNSFSYMTINRTWETGDVVSVSLPMQTSLEYLPDGSNWAAFVHGPIVLAAVTDTTDLGGLFADEGRMAHVASDLFYPIDEAPVLLTNEPDEIVNSISKTGPLSFNIDSLLYPNSFSELKLVPFFTIHEARYMMYWPVLTEKELDERQEEVKRREAAMIALEKRTVDMVATGEQQPETEHNFQGENTESGIHNSRYWRHASGWFSYDLSNPGKEGNILRVTYSGGDSGRTFDILINGEVLETITSTGHKDLFFDVDYVIPDSILAENMTVRFQAHENSIAGGVFEIRLLRE